MPGAVGAAGWNEAMARPSELRGAALTVIVATGIGAGIVSDSIAAGGFRLAPAYQFRCYTRIYSEDQLANHPRRRVEAASLHAAGADEGRPSAANIALRLTLRRPPEVVEVLGRCDPDGDEFRCYFEGGAGEARIRRQGDSQIRLDFSRLSYESEARAADLDTAKGADDVMILETDEAEACDAWRVPEVTDVSQ